MNKKKRMKRKIHSVSLIFVIFSLIFFLIIRDNQFIRIMQELHISSGIYGEIRLRALTEGLLYIIFVILVSIIYTILEHD